MYAAKEQDSDYYRLDTDFFANPALHNRPYLFLSLLTSLILKKEK